MKISLHIIVLIVRGCFDRTHGLNKLFFALETRALLMFNYDKPSRIFPCILLTRNHIIFLVKFGINKHEYIFLKTRIQLVLDVHNRELYTQFRRNNRQILYSDGNQTQIRTESRQEQHFINVVAFIRRIQLKRGSDL